MLRWVECGQPYRCQVFQETSFGTIVNQEPTQLVEEGNESKMSAKYPNLLRSRVRGPRVIEGKSTKSTPLVAQHTTDRRVDKVGETRMQVME